MVNSTENLDMNVDEKCSLPIDPVSIWSYKQLGEFFMSQRSQDTYLTEKDCGIKGTSKQQLNMGSNIESIIQFPDLDWSASTSAAGQRMHVLENRALIGAHLLAPWTQEESLLESFVAHLNELCRTSVTGSPEISQLEDLFPGIAGRVLYFSLISSVRHVYTPNEILMSFCNAILSHRMLSCLVVKETLKECAADLANNPSQDTPMLKFQLVLMGRVPVVFTVSNSTQEQEYSFNGLTSDTKDFPAMWFNTYQPLLYHFTQIVIYWAQISNFTEFSTICQRDRGVGFNLFSLMNMVMCSFLRTQKNLRPDYPLLSLLIEFFAFFSSFAPNSFAVYILNHEQNYLCRRSSSSHPVCKHILSTSTPDNIRDPARIQVLSPLNWEHDLTSYVTVSRNFIDSCRSNCKSLFLYITEGVIDTSSTFLKVILYTNDCIQNRKLDVTTCNKILNSNGV